MQKSPPNQIDQEKILKEIKEKINQIRTYTPKVGVFGNSGVGKSSLCNALFGKEVAKISDVEACTRKPQEIFIGNGNGGIKLIDVPGIGEDIQHQKEYTQLYKSLLPELDLVLWAIKSDDRNYASGLEAYQEVFQGKNLPPLIFVITQTDKTNDIEDWDYESYQPGGAQIGNIAIKENDISKRFSISTKNIISVAISKKGRSYNLKNLVEIIVDTLPNEKKYSLTREIKGENVSIQARTNAEIGIWEAIKDFAGEALDTVKDKAKDLIIETIPELASKVKDVVLSSIGKFFRWF